MKAFILFFKNTFLCRKIKNAYNKPKGNNKTNFIPFLLQYKKEAQIFHLLSYNLETLQLSKIQESNSNLKLFFNALIITKTSSCSNIFTNSSNTQSAFAIPNIIKAFNFIFTTIIYTLSDPYYKVKLIKIQNASFY